MAEYDYVFKYLILGDKGVGKRSIMQRFSQNQFFAESDSPNGLQFKQKKMNVSHTTINVQLWAIANQSQFIKHIFVYDITNRSTFSSIKDLLANNEDAMNQKAELVLFGNKSDQGLSRKVSIEEGQQFAQQNGMMFFEGNAKTGSNIEELFYSSALAILQQIDENKIDPEIDYGIFIGGRNPNIGALQGFAQKLCEI